MSDPLETLERVVADAVLPHAALVDRDAAFPREAVEALGRAGLLGVVSAREVGGLGQGPALAAQVVERLARACGSSAMVACMHYAAVAVVEQHGDRETRAALARGEALATLAFSEQGSRSHFWAPVGSAVPEGAGVRLDARKSWVTAAHHATHYVWSSKPTAGSEASTLWLVPATAPGLSVPAPFAGLGLRGNDSCPVDAVALRLPASARLGADGGGFGIMMGTVLPIFNLMNAGCSLGLARAALEGAIGHAGATRHAHLGTTLADLPTIRAQVARMQIQHDATRALWLDSCAAVEAGRADAPLRVLEAKAAAGEAALEVVAAAMRVCGGAAYRGDVGVERRFRDAQAASVMAPTTDQLWDFIGKALCGLPLFG